MWPLDRLQQRLHPPPQPSIRQLLQEQNQLLRELIFALTHAPANTKISQANPPASRPRRKLTDADVIRVPREVYVEDRRLAQEQQIAPWRAASIPTIPADPTAAATLTVPPPNPLDNPTATNPASLLHHGAASGPSPTPRP